jgi:Polyketide cyclase / dehydrase and lipid transport
VSSQNVRSEPVTTVSQPVVSASLEIAAPASQIFDILADPRRHIEIDGSHMLRLCLDGPDRLGPGSEFVMSMRFCGIPYRVRNRVVEFEENRLIAWRHVEPQHWRFELQPTESGTRVTETFDYSYWPPAGRLLLVALGWPRRNAPAITQTRATRKRSPDQPNRNNHMSEQWQR